MKSWRRGFMRCSRREDPWGSHHSAARALKCETSLGLTDEVAEAEAEAECHRGCWACAAANGSVAAPALATGMVVACSDGRGTGRRRRAFVAARVGAAICPGVMRFAPGSGELRMRMVVMQGQASEARGVRSSAGWMPRRAAAPGIELGQKDCRTRIPPPKKTADKGRIEQQLGPCPILPSGLQKQLRGRSGVSLDP